jgi:hypothetical protein
VYLTPAVLATVGFQGLCAMRLGLAATNALALTILR